MDTATSLTQLGLSEKQAKVYLSLLELGEAGMTEVADNADLKRPTVYLVIDELINLGLCGEIIKGKKRLYSAAHPRRLVQITNLRNEQSQKILPELVALQNTAEKPKVRMLEGWEGIKTAYEEAYATLSKNEEGLWIGNVGLLEEKFPEILDMYYKTVVKSNDLRIREIILGGDNYLKWVKKMKGSKHFKNYEVRRVTPPYSFGATDRLIVGSKVMTFVLGKETFVLIVESKEIAETERGTFELAWQKCERVN